VNASRCGTWGGGGAGSHEYPTRSPYVSCLTSSSRVEMEGTRCFERGLEGNKTQSLLFFVKWWPRGLVNVKEWLRFGRPSWLIAYEPPYSSVSHSNSASPSSPAYVLGCTMWCNDVVKYDQLKGENSVSQANACLVKVAAMLSKVRGEAFATQRGSLSVSTISPSCCWYSFTVSGREIMAAPQNLESYPISRLRRAPSPRHGVKSVGLYPPVNHL